MFRNNLLRKNSGFLLLSTYFFIILLIVFAATFFSQAVHEHKFTQRALDNMAARYLAEKGADSALTEIKYNTSFRTHTVNSETSLLEKVEGQLTLHLGNVAIDGDGNYISLPTDSPAGRFLVKVYPDPNNDDELIVLAKGIKGNASRLFATKYVASSLYRFFIFTPYDYRFGSKIYNAGGGGIHANGWFVFDGDADITDVSEMSTDKYLKYYARGFVPPGDTTIDNVGPYQTNINPSTGQPYTWEQVFWQWRAPWIQNPNQGSGSNCPNGYCQYYNNQDGQNWGDFFGGLYMLGQSGYVPWDGTPETWINPYDFANRNVYACQDNTCLDPDIEANTRLTSINGIFIPNRFETSYDWNVYEHLDLGGYWSDNGLGFWSLGRFWIHDPLNIDANHFNSEPQYSEWDHFLESLAGQSLANIVQDHNRGGNHIEPLEVGNATAYKDAAENDGIYIEYDGSGEPAVLNVKIKGVSQEWDGDQIKISVPGGDIGVFYKQSFVDTNSTQTKNVITFFLNKFLEATAAEDPSGNGSLRQNIIYSNYPLVIRDAQAIFTNGLSTVCKENVYLHGPYNTQPAQEEIPPGWVPPPSAVISAKYTYTLSPYFNFPETLPDMLTNPNAPYEHDFYCPQGNQSCISNLIEYYGRRPAETTHANYPAGRNWYAEHEANMSNKVTGFAGESFNYNVALVGYRGYEPQILERWRWYDDPGTSLLPPSSQHSSTRTIKGAFVQLQKDDFQWVGYPDENIPTFDFWKTRCCGDPGFPPGSECRDCSQYPGWPWMATSMIPDPSFDSRLYDTQFASGNVPPGDLLGFSTAVFLELDLNDSPNPWLYHSTQISSPPQG